MVNIESKLREVGKKEGLENEHLEAFIRFFKARFPNHMNSDYPYTWANRFKHGNVLANTDTISREEYFKAYRSLLEY